MTMENSSDRANMESANEELDNECESFVRKLKEYYSNTKKVREILFSDDFDAKDKKTRGRILDKSEILVKRVEDQLYDLAEDIIKKGGDPNLQGKDGRTALMWASYHGKDEIVDTLVRNGSDINKRDGKTALMHSHWNGDYETSVLLLNNGANIKEQDQINFKDKEDRTLLHRAVEESSEEIVNLILSQGSPDLSIVNKDLQTAFLLAKDKGAHDIADLIMSKETPKTFIKGLFNILKGNCLESKKCCTGLKILLNILKDQIKDIKDENGSTPFSCSHFTGHYDTSVELINLEDKEDINCMDREGWTFLHRAVEKTKKETIKSILSEDNLDLDLSILNADLQTAFLLAKNLEQEDNADQERKNITKLIEKRETQETYKAALFNILKSNCQGECCKGLEILLNKLQPDALQKLNDEATKLSALTFAAMNGHSRLLEKFLKGHSEWKDDNDPSLIWQASFASQSETVKILLDHKNTAEKWDQKAKVGTNALNVALLKKNDDIVKLMMEHDQFQKNDKAKEACTQFGKFTTISKLRINDLKHCQLALKSNNEKIYVNDTYNRQVKKEVAEHLFQKLTEEQKAEIKSQNKDLHSNEMRRILGFDTEQTSSDLMELTNKWRVMNDKIEDDKIGLEISGDKLEFSDMRKEILGDFCCFSAGEGATEEKGEKIVSIKQIKIFECEESCKKKDECRSVVDMIRLCKLLEKRMRRRMSKLKPKLILIGSIAEGTRIGKAVELDVTVQFEGLEDSPFTIKENATELWTHGLMDRWGRRGIFSYACFLEWFLNEIHECLSDIKIESIELFLNQLKDCTDCSNVRKSDTIYAPHSHCEKHLVTVTTTRLGACLIFKWNTDRVQSIDLIPVFPIISKGTFHLFNLVISTLINEQYPNWLPTSQKIMSRDAILPEAFEAQKEEKGKSCIAIKILHYGPHNNYIIRPAQEMNIEEFHKRERVKRVYNHIKVMKCGFRMGENVKSYFVKKTVILPDFLQKAKDKNRKFPRLLFDALSHPELKREFKDKVNFDEWQKELTQSQDSLDYIILPKKGGSAYF